MFWGKKSGKEGTKEKASGPQAIPGLVQKESVAEKKVDAEWPTFVKAVVRISPKGGGMQDIRIFDPDDAEARKVEVKDYTSLDAHPELIIYEGQFDEATKKVELQEKKKAAMNVPVLTEEEIRQKLEGLSQPGNTVFFYLAAGPRAGGPLGRGAVVVELNPNYPGKKKKYILYRTDVVDMQPMGKGEELFDLDKAKDVAHWIKFAHHKRGPWA